MGLLRNAISRARGGNPLNIRETEPSIGGTIFGPPLPPGPITRPSIGRPIPPISIGGIGGIDAIKPIKKGQPVPSPIVRRPSPGAGVPSELLPIKGGPRPIQIQPIPRPIQPIDIPAPILPDPRDSIDRTLPPLAPIDIPAPVLPDPIGGIGRPIPPISIGGIGGGRPGLTLQPPIDDPLLRPRVDASPTQELIPQVDESGRPVTPPSIGGIGAPVGTDLREAGFLNMPEVTFDGPPVSMEEAEASVDPRANRQRGPIVGGMVPGGGGIDYGGGEGPPLLPDLRTNMNIETRDTEFGPVTISSPAFPVRGPIIPPEDFGFGPGIRPSEIFDEQGNIVVGSGGVTPPVDEFGRQGKLGPSREGLVISDEARRLAEIYAPDKMNFQGGPGKFNPEAVRRSTLENIQITLDAGGGEADVQQLFSNIMQPAQSPFNTEGQQITVPPVADIASDPVSPVPTTPAAVATDVGTDPAVTTPATVAGSVDPVLAQQDTVEDLSDPLVRALYFGTADQPGFINQLQQAGANLIGSEVPLQQTAGLTPLELLARQQAVAGLGGFEPFFQQNKDLIDQAIGQSRRAEALRDPYFQRAEQQMLLGLGDQLGGIDQARGITIGATDRFGRSLGRLGRQQIGATDAFGRRLSDVEARGEGAAGRFGESLSGIEAGAVGATDMFGQRLGESEDLIRGTLGGYDQGLTQQFYNPFEDAVVQQTIDDVIEAGEKQDIAARAREIGAGAFGGSRARLSAAERREALGKGLAESLGRIRQQGFGEAQRIGLSEFARQREAERAASRGLSGLAGTRFGAETGLLDRLTSGAQQRLAAEQGVVDLLGRTGQQQLGAQQQLGSTLRGFTGDQFGAQRQLAQSLLGFGSAGAGARQNLASGLLGIGQQRGAGAQQLGQSLAGFGQQIGGIGSTLDALRRGQRSELAGFGSIGRGIAETGLGRLFEQQTAQQLRPLQTLGQIGQFLPQFQQGRTRIESQYRLPTDPSAAGLGAAFNAYAALAPKQGAG